MLRRKNESTLFNQFSSALSFCCSFKPRFSNRGYNNVVPTGLENLEYLLSTLGIPNVSSLRTSFYHLSVRKGARGKPSVLNTSGMVVSSKQKRTATGVFTNLEERAMVEPSILAVAGTKF